MTTAREPLPTGTVTLLLGDVEGSVRLWEAEPEAMGAAAIRLDVLVTDVVAAHHGARPVEQGEGDSFVLAFARADDAVACALGLQLAVAAEPWPAHLDLRVRLGLHTGDVDRRDEGNYAGPAINRCARLRSLGGGGQSLLSRTTADLVQDRLPDEATLRELGSFRLRDLARNERLFQLCHPDLPDGFPPLRDGLAPPHNLPSPLTALVGRAGELADVLRLLKENRLVTLTGAGGCGKTRLAVEAAAELVDTHVDGVWWVELAPVADPSLVTGTLTAALSVQLPHHVAGPEALAAALGDRDLVIVLDNCEHLVAGCAAVVEVLLAHCPGLRVLATTREPLFLDGEATYRVPSLSLPSSDAGPDEVAGSEAVRLFVERATRVRPDFALTGQEHAVAEICRRLDGIPLAIELAAGRCRMLAPARIAAALSDRFRLLTGGARTALPRQRTLEASVDWSYALLAEEERTVLARLSVFAGTFDLEAAEAVCAGDGAVDPLVVLDLLAALVDRSLLQVDAERAGELRYRLLETVRAYARQRLVETGAAGSARDRHLAHYVDEAVRRAPRLTGPVSVDAFDGLDGDLDNLRAAMDWAMETGQPAAIRIAAPLGHFWLARGLFVEIRGRMEVALMTVDDPRLRAQALFTLSQVTFMGGDYRAGLLHAEAAVELAHEVGDEPTVRVGTAWLAWCECLTGAPVAVSRAHAEEAERLAENGAGDWALIRPLYTRGGIEAQHVGPRAGIPWLARAVDAGRRAGSTAETVYAELFLGILLREAGDYTEARRHAEESLAAAVAIGNTVLECYAHAVLGAVDGRVGAPVSARERLDLALQMARRHGLALFEAIALLGSGELRYAAGELDRARSELTEARDRGHVMGDVSTVAGAEALLALTCLARGDIAGGREAVARARDLARRYERLVVPFGAAVLAEARIDRADGDLAAAEAQAHEALDIVTAAQVDPAVADTLDTLAAVAADLGEPQQGARLFGAAQRLRSELGFARFPVDQAGYDRDLGRTRYELGDEAFDRAWTEGIALSAEEAVSYARRGRGARRRPSHGWDALTPTELEVVRLVGRGMTNPAIAEMLFMSRNTVKSHVTHVFTKLGVTTRAGLAGEAARRELRDGEASVS